MSAQKNIKKNKYKKTKHEEFFKRIFGENYRLVDLQMDIGAGISIAFIPIGSRFRIDEYDGSETIVIYNPDKYFEA